MSKLPEERRFDVQPRLSLTGISKRFGGVKAIRHADFHVLPGEAHALVGENGAGKSTLIKIVSGAEVPDTGSIEIDGQLVDVKNASNALDMGVATVYQEAQLFPQLTVAENIFLGRELTHGPTIDWAAQDKLVRDALETVGLDPSCVHRKVEELPAGQQQQVSIAKALAGDARILILDEPSAILTDTEIANLFAAIRNLKSRGVAVIYISHRLDELAKVADVVTIMRDGQTLGTFAIDDLSVGQIIETMVGGAFEESIGTSYTTDELALSVTGLESRKFSNVNLEVCAGEVVVLYGLVGSGMAEIAAAIYGMERVSAGSLTLRGQAYTPTSPSEARKSGVLMLPADRKREGMFSFKSIAFNISVGALGLMRKWGFVVDAERERSTADRLIRQLGIKTQSHKNAIATLSGGNAQKVVLARQLVERPPLLVLAEPTQGVDVGAKEEIHRIISQLCREGTGVLIATSDLGEALRVADRLIVVRNGECFAEFGPDASQAIVLAAASGDLATGERKPKGS